MARVLLMFCPACNDYTLQEKCPRCSGATRSNRPAKYSPEDPYGEYRRRLKKQVRIEDAQAAGGAS